MPTRLANTPASRSNQAARAKEGSRCLVCVRVVHEMWGFRGWVGCLVLVVHEMRGFRGWVVVFGVGCPWNVGFLWMGGGVLGWSSMKCGVFVDGDCLRGCLHERMWRLGIGMKL